MWPSLLLTVSSLIGQEAWPHAPFVHTGIFKKAPYQTADEGINGWTVTVWPGIFLPGNGISFPSLRQNRSLTAKSSTTNVFIFSLFVCYPHAERRADHVSWCLTCCCHCPLVLSPPLAGSTVWNEKPNQAGLTAPLSSTQCATTQHGTAGFMWKNGICVRM